MTSGSTETHKRWAASYRPRRDTADPDYQERWYAEQCGGCAAYLPVLGPLGNDWGVCSNAASPADGTLRFEHDGCEAFTPAADSDPAPFR